MEDVEKRLNDNTGLVYFTLRRYFPSLVGDEDLFQEGSIGLWKACLNYDGRAKFSTFAVLCIRNEILMSLRKQRRHADVTSLDAPIRSGGDGEASSIGDLLVDPQASAFETDIGTNDFVQRLRERDRHILALRIAGLTQKDIAKSIGVSQVGVSRRLNKIGSLYKANKLT